MKRMYRFAQSLLGLVAVFAIVATVSAPRTHAADNKVDPVTVVNTPLPITGNTTVSGTVAITPLPLPTQDVDNSARHPFQIKLSEFSDGNVHRFTVPSNQRLTIEFVSSECIVPLFAATFNSWVMGITTTAGGNEVTHHLNPRFVHTGEGGTSFSGSI